MRFTNKPYLKASFRGVKTVKFYFDLTCQIEKKLKNYQEYDEFVQFFEEMEPKFLEYGFDLQEYKPYIDSFNNKKNAIDNSILKTKIEMKFRDLPLLSSNFNHYLKNLEKLKVENDPYAVEFVREKYAQCDQIKRKSTFEIYNEALNLKSNLKIFKRRAKAFDDFNLFFVSANQEMINLYHKSLNQKNLIVIWILKIEQFLNLMIIIKKRRLLKILYLNLGKKERN